jgi:ribA/ribD-fused uncharacterized protein
MIDSLKGTYLSNFWSVPIVYEGLTYQNAESAFQASKCINLEARNWFVNTPPQLAKAKGRLVEIRPDWNEVRLQVMWNVLQAKFAQHPDLAAKLVATGDQEIVEGNTWNDKFWGVCNGEGMNHLGIMLMAIREECK